MSFSKLWFCNSKQPIQFIHDKGQYWFWLERQGEGYEGLEENKIKGGDTQW
jgi:hypothetical protein